MDESDPGSNAGGPIGLGGVAEEPDPDCHIDGCDRPGAVPRKMRGRDEEGPTFEHHLCRFHYRVLLGVKVTVAAVVLGVFLVVFFTQ